MIAAIVCAGGCRQIFGLHELANRDAPAATDVRRISDISTSDVIIADVPGLDGPTAAATLAADTYLSNHPNTTGNNYGTDQTVYSEADPAGVFRALLRFDVSSLAGKTVTAAELDVYVTTAASSTVDVNLYQITQAWDEATTTWTNTNTSTLWLTGGASPPKSSDSTMLATALVPQQTGLYRLAINSDGVTVINSWIGGAENDGFVLASDSIASWQFASRENVSSYPPATLVIAY